MNPGTIIFLNGTSSSGKTSIVRALQDAFDEPCLEAGLDKFLWMLPTRYLERPLWDDVLGLANQAGETGHLLVIGMHRAVETLSRSGIHVLADHVLVEAAWWQDIALRFCDLPAFLVGVRCPLAVAEDREKARRNRTLGQARTQFELVHGTGIYDVEVDTSRSTPQECAALIMARVKSGSPPTALCELKHQFTSTPAHNESSAIIKSLRR